VRLAGLFTSILLFFVLTEAWVPNLISIVLFCWVLLQLRVFGFPDSLKVLKNIREKDQRDTHFS